MKNTKRILCVALAMVLVLSIMLTGCSRPKITFNKIPENAATYGDGQVITSGQYFAYLYLEFENLYYNQGLYQYEMYGMDPWEQQFPYGESGEKLYLSDYILRAAQDNIKRQIVLQQIMKDNGISWVAEDEAEIDKFLNENKNGDSFNFNNYLGYNVNSIEMGVNFDSYSYAYKNANLNERSTFYGLYGKGGKREIAESELKDYFEKNYISYKAISIPLTDSKGKELDKEGEAYKKIMDSMNKYMETYKKDGFLAAYEQYEKDQADINKLKETEATKTTTTTSTSSTATGTGTGTDSSTSATTSATTTTTTTTTTTATETTTSTSNTTTGTTTGTTAAEKEDEHAHDHQLRVDVDSSSTDMDEALKDAILGKKDKDGKVEQEGVKVGECKIVEYKAGGSTPTVALIERLDIHKDDEGKEGAVYENAVENIIYTKAYEGFNKEVIDAMTALKITFDPEVVAARNPKDFLAILNGEKV